MVLTASQIAAHVEGELVGDGGLSLSGVEEISAARRGQLTFIGDERYVGRWASSEASAALVDRRFDLEPGQGRALIRVDQADLAMARVLELFAPAMPRPGEGVHPSAVVDASAELGEGVCIGPGCVIGPGARIGAGSVLQAQVSVMAESSVGAEALLWPGVVIRERCELGARCQLHPNVSIGADGFGYRPAASGQGLVKIPQIGTVRVGDDVEMGAGTCVDRGKFSATTIGDGTKLDNLVQIGHNCRIGRWVVIAGSCGVAGSVTIEDGCVIGGMVAIKDHVTVGAGATLTGGAQVMHDVPAGATWGGSPARPLREAARQVQALKRLPDLERRLRRG